MSGKSRYKGRRKGKRDVVVAQPAPRPARPVRKDPPDLEALRAALRRLGGRAVVKVLPDIYGQPNPIMTFADDAAKAEFERVFSEELAARRVVLPHEVAHGA